MILVTGMNDSRFRFFHSTVTGPGHIGSAGSITIGKAILAFRQVKVPSPMESGTPRSISVFHVWHLPPQFIFPVAQGDSFLGKFPSRSIGKPCFSVASSVLRMHASGRDGMDTALPSGTRPQSSKHSNWAPPCAKASMARRVREYRH
jgi:hypothetical protein